MRNKKIVQDLQDAIRNIIQGDIEDAIGRIRRTIVEVEGLENIWTEGMNNYEKAVVMIKRGFDFTVMPRASTKDLYGIRIDYLGYHLWDLTEGEITRLKKEKVNCDAQEQETYPETGSKSNLS